MSDDNNTIPDGTSDARVSNFVAQGWQCPVCKRVNAPFVSQCTCGGLNGYQTLPYPIQPVTPNPVYPIPPPYYWPVWPVTCGPTNATVQGGPVFTPNNGTFGNAHAESVHSYDAHLQG